MKRLFIFTAIALLFCSCEREIPVTSISLNKTTLSLKKGNSETLTVTVTPSEATNKNIYWTSNNDTIAKVSGDGTITAITPGTATITVATEDGALTATCDVTVAVPVENINFEEQIFYLVDGLDSTLTVTFSPSNATNKNVIWSSSDESVATIDTSGKVSSISLGTTTITAISEDGAKTATCDVTVQRLTVHVGTAGTLSTLIPDEDIPKIRQMVITGTLNDDDYSTIRNMISLFYLDMSELNDITMPNGALRKSPLKTVYLPSNLEAIPPSLLELTTITSIIIPSTVKTIGENAFYKNYYLTGSLVIPDSVITIGNGAFCDCYGFTGTLTLGKDVESIGICAFTNCSGFTGDLIIPDAVTKISNSAFACCSGFDGTLKLGQSILYIGMEAFFKCSRLTGNLIIPDGVTSIAFGAFSACYGFTGRLNIPDSVVSIGNCAFYDCTGFDGDLTIGHGLNTITLNIFYGCTGFSGNLIIPENISKIEEGAFNGCDGLTHVFCERANPPDLASDSFTTWNQLTVPTGSKTSYEAADYWKDFTTIDEQDF